MTADEVADRIELRALVDAYATALDTRDSDGLVALFTPDAHFGIYEPGRSDPSHAFNGAAELATLMEMLRVYGDTMHLMANHTVTIDGDGAAGEVYCLAHHLTDKDGETVDLVMTIRYRDRYARTSAGWRLARREVVRFWNEVHPVMAERTTF